MKFSCFIFLLFSMAAFCQKKGGAVLPTKAQLNAQNMEFYLFTHFGPNTFTDKEWGEGTEQEDVFNPTNLDCRQWCRIAKQAGATGIIITAKHHDGFCLWPSKYSTHTVRESKWKNGKGDVLKELSKACKEYGLKFGVYLSPWDRNHPKYGTAGYNDVFVNMMTEIFRNYGPIWELWWDGANGEGPNGKKQVYDWKRFENTVRKLSPNTVIFSDIGPDLRWCGNENGIAGETNWDYLDTAGFSRGKGSPPTDTLNQGNIDGKNWIPAECDVSIRPGWFYHKEQDEKVKTAPELFELYLKSVGRGANLLLNVPPDRTGKINEHDSAALVAFRKLRNENFKNNLMNSSIVEHHRLLMNYGERKPSDTTNALTDKNDHTYVELAQAGPFIEVRFKKPTNVNCIVLQELIRLGQSIKSFSIQLNRGGEEVSKLSGTTIGRKKILVFPGVAIDSFKIFVNDAKGKALLSEVSAFYIDENLTGKL